MSEERFRKIWQHLQAKSCVEFYDRGEKYRMRKLPLMDVCLEKVYSNSVSTVCIHWSEAHFARMFVTSWS